MAVGIYDEEYGDVATSDGNHVNALLFRAEPGGDVVEAQLFLRHQSLSGADAESSYDVVIEPIDNTPTDESSWVEIAADDTGAPDTYSSSQSLGDVLVGSIVPFWVQVTVPGSYSPYGQKTDIGLKLTSTSTTNVIVDTTGNGEISEELFLKDGSPTLSAIEAGEGSWTSDWIDVSTWTAFFGVDEADTTGDLVSISYEYRDSALGSSSDASAWYDESDSVDISRGFIQVKATLRSSGGVPQGLSIHVWDDDYNIAIDFADTYPHESPDVQASSGYVLTYSQSSANDYIREWGYYYAPVDGTYTYRIDNTAYMRSRLWIDNVEQGDDEVLDTWTYGEGGEATIYLTQGLHAVRLDISKQGSGSQTTTVYVTVPDEAETSDATWVASYVPSGWNAELSLNSISLRATGTFEQVFDMTIFNGPDTPVLVWPPDGYETRSFDPIMEAYARNVDSLDFEISDSITFASVDAWNELAEDDQTVSTMPVDADRPSGTYYWRVRTELAGEYSPWADPREIIILDITNNRHHLYLLGNVGVVEDDPTQFSRFLTLQANVGFNFGDVSDFRRFLYHLCNVSQASGKIVYPILDKTLTRRQEFDLDDEFIEE